jgi:hypothetical protein
MRSLTDCYWFLLRKRMRPVAGVSGAEEEGVVAGVWSM